MIHVKVKIKYIQMSTCTSQNGSTCCKPLIKLRDPCHVKGCDKTSTSFQTSLCLPHLIKVSRHAIDENLTKWVYSECLARITYSWTNGFDSPPGSPTRSKQDDPFKDEIVEKPLLRVFNMLDYSNERNMLKRSNKWQLYEDGGAAHQSRGYEPSHRYIKQIEVVQKEHIKMV